MMTGAIVGGKPVEQAAKLQSEQSELVVSFSLTACSDNHVQFVGLGIVSSQTALTFVVIAASSALSTLAALFFALTTLVDSHHRIRLDKLDARKPTFYAWRDRGAKEVWRWVSGLWRKIPEKPSSEEMAGLLRTH